MGDLIGDGGDGWSRLLGRDGTQEEQETDACVQCRVMLDPTPVLSSYRSDGHYRHSFQPSTQAAAAGERGGGKAAFLPTP